MMKQRLKGLWQQIRGGTKRGYGDLTGDRKAKVTGTVDQKTGSVREGVGRAVDDVKRNIRYGDPGDTAHV